MGAGSCGVASQPFSMGFFQIFFVVAGMSSIFIDEVEICKDGPALGIMYVCSTFLIKTQCMQNGVTVVLKGRGVQLWGLKREASLVSDGEKGERKSSVKLSCSCPCCDSVRAAGVKSMCCCQAAERRDSRQSKVPQGEAARHKYTA